MDVSAKKYGFKISLKYGIELYFKKGGAYIGMDGWFSPLSGGYSKQKRRGYFIRAAFVLQAFHGIKTIPPKFPPSRCS